MVLILGSKHIQIMTEQAEWVYPEECCGLLLGVWVVEDDRRLVHEILPMVNQWTDGVLTLTEGGPSAVRLNKRNRYWVEPKDLMEAQRYGRDHGWIILGVYHSHPNHPAVPSERDRRLAWSEYSYPILSIVDGNLVDLQSWRLDPENQFQPEFILRES